MQKIKVGIVGCGRIAPFHMDALKLNQNYEIAAVCDVLPERAKAAADKYGAKAYASIDEMLSQEKLGLVTLTTPSGQHPSQARACADAGVPCLSEKPFGVYYDEARGVVEHFERKNVPLFVVKQNRYNPTVAKVRQLLNEGAFGKLYMIQSNVFWQRPQDYYDAAKWRGRRDMDGGAFMNQASHYVDLIQWFGGEVDHVKSELSTYQRKIECEDTGATLIRFKNGAIGVLAVTMLTYPENLEGTLTIMAEKATVRLGGRALNKLEVCRIEGRGDLVKELQELNYEPATVYGNGHGVYYHELLRFLKEPKHPEAITGREGLKSLRLICQIYGDAV